MHPDKKVGLALGILLIGIVGAFFFRNEVPDPDSAVPALVHGRELDQRIRHQQHAPYLDSDQKRKTQPETPTITDVFASDVVPRIPNAGTNAVPEPIRPQAQREAEKNIPVPLPTEGGGLQSPNAQRAEQGGASSVPSNSATTAGTHEVQPGETLSSIAAKHLGSHRKYLELYEFNKDVLSSPNALKPGMKLKLSATAAPSTRPVSPTGTTADIAPPVPMPPANESTSAGTEPRRTTDASSNELKPEQAPPVKPGFVRPKNSPVRPPTPGGKSLTQAPPPDVPRLEGLDPRRDPAVLASRPRADEETKPNKN